MRLPSLQLTRLLTQQSILVGCSVLRKAQINRRGPKIFRPRESSQPVVLLCSCSEDKSLMLPIAPVVPRSPSRRQTSANTLATSVAISPVDKSATISVVLILTPIYLCNIVLAATSRGGRGVARIEVRPNCQLFLRWFADGWASDETRGP